MKLKQFIFALAVMLSGFAISVNAQEAKIGTTTYGTLAEAVNAAAAGDEIVLLKNVTLQGGYDADPTAGLRIEKALTINGNKKTIDCGTFKDGIRVYITGSSKADVKFENVTIKNNNPNGRCIDMRTGKIALEVKSGAKLIAQGVNSQPLTIGGSAATYRVRVSNATIDAGETGYGIISFVRVTNNIEFSSSVKISGLAALYLKEGANNTTVTMGNGTYTGTNLKSAESGTFGAVVIEGDNNTIVVNHEKSVVKAVAGDDVNQTVQAAFLVKEGATGNKIQVTNANAQVLTEGAQAQWAVVASDATNNVLINKGQTVNFAVECGGYLYMDANKAFSMVIPQEKEATTVKLLSDVTLDNTWTVAAGQDITLDLNGKTINVAYAEGSTTNHIYAIDNKGTLKITGNGTINARGIFNYGTMTLENGTINAIDGNGGYAVRNYAGSLIMNGGTIATTLEDDHQVNNGGYDATTVRVDEGATFTMNGGELNNICDYTFAIENHGTTTVKGGKATSVHTTVANYGTINIEGGEFVCNGLEGITAHAVWAAEGTTNISGGTFNGKDNYNGFNVDASEGAVVNITGGKFLDVHSGSLYGEGTIAVSGGIFFDAVPEKYCANGYSPIENANGTFGVREGNVVAKIGDAKYYSLAEALAAAADGATIELINQEGSVIAMNGSLYGNKSVTITGTATVDWSKGWLFVGRGGAGNATLTFDNADLTSASNSSSYGIHVSGREKNTTDKYDGTLVIKNSAIELDFLINKGAMTLDNSSLTVKNGFDINGRPASETENGEDANATLALTNNSKLVVNNHNGMGIGREGKGELTVDATSTFEHTQDFIVRANGTMDVKGTLVSNGKKLTNNGEVKFTATKLTNATIEGTGTTRFYNDVNFYGANSITTTGINGAPFHLVVNEGANLFITRFVLGYDRNITVNGTIADASAFNPAGQTPSLKFNSTSGVSVGGTGTGNLTVKNAYIELGSSSWKNAQGTYDWDFENSYVSATSFTNAAEPGAVAAKWDVTFDKSILDAKNYIKNGKNVTYNFTNNSRGTTGSLRIDGVLNIDATSSVVTTSQQNNKVGVADEHGGINGTVNVAGSLTIGSNSKTQLEVLGGKVNVKEGATLALGNNTMTLDATSAMQSAGNISGAITAANGANVAISGGKYTQDVNNWCAEGFMTQQNADGSFGIAKAVAKVGDNKYASLDEAFAAAKEGETITLIADVTPSLTSQRAITKAALIDLGDKTMTLTEDDLYFGTTTFKNGTIVVDPTVNASTAVFWMFENQTLTFDNVDIVATGVSGTYLIGINGGTGTAVNLVNGSSITIDGASLGTVICDNGTGNTVTIKDSDIEINNTNARLYLGGTNGKITVENSDIDLNGVKEGFYLRAGQTLAITGTSTVDITLNTNEGRYGINLTDATAKYTKAETATVNASLFEKKGGNNFNGYTRADGIWGEVWGNAKESFVIKVLDANGNVMGTTSLNNIGGIIDGDVNVSWSLKFNAAANTDEYWSMEWTTAPSISNMPARVALWVDGVEVSGGPVVLNGPDDIQKIVAAVTDADGKIISCHTSVALAAAANATNIALLRETTETIELPVGTILNKNGFTAAGVTVKPVAKVGNTEYASIDAAIAAWTNNTTLTLLADVTLSDVITLSSQEHHYLALGTYTMTAASGKNAIEIKSYGRDNRSESGALTITADATNPGGINAGKQKCIYYKYDTTLANDKYDRPIIYIKGGVFVGNSYNGINCSGHSSAQDKCATFDISGGTFNCGLNLAKAKLLISGGTFNESVSCTGGGTSLRLISGGTFKTIGFMTADSNNTKFWFGTSMGNSNVGVHVDDNGYIVVGGPVVTEAGETFEASSTNYSGASSYLKYSSAKDNGLYYTAVEEALKDNSNNANAVVTVYADEVDMDNINYKGTIIIPADSTVTITGAPADLKVVTTDGYFVTNNVTDNKVVYESKVAVAQMGGKQYASIAEALAEAQNANLTDVVITIVGENTTETADKFNLYQKSAFDKVTFKQENGNKPYYFDELYTGSRTNEGQFVFDGVNLVVISKGQYIFEGNVVLSNNSYIKSNAEANCFVYNAEVTVQAGSKIDGVIEDIRGGSLIIDGGKTDGTYCKEPDLRDAILTVNWTNSNLVLKNGAYVKINSANEIGRLTVNGTLDVANSKLESYQWIQVNEKGTMKLKAGSYITTNELKGNGNITIDATGMAAGDVVLTAKTVNFTGTLSVINSDKLKAKIVDGKIVLVALVAKIGDVAYETLQAAIDAAQNDDVITLIDNCAENVTVVQAPDVKFTIDGNGNTMTGAITIDGKSYAYATAGVTIKNVKFDASAIATDACINLGDKNNTLNTRYTSNVTVENCTFTGGNQKKAAIKAYTGGDKNLTVTGCTVDNTMHSLIQATNIVGVVVDNCTVNSKNGINLNSSSNVEIKNSTIDVNGYAVRAGVDGGESGKVELANNTLKTNGTEDAVIVIRGTASEQINLAMSQNVVSGATHISGTTNKTKVSADANYWDGETAPVTSGTEVAVNSYYKDEALQQLVRIEKGSIYAHVYADRIFGDVTTNAAESLVVEIIGADGTVIGTSALEKPEYCVGTMKTLTWRINFGADDSGSWAMQWNEGAPSINNIPTKVKVIVDGKEMAEAAIKYTANGDGQSPVVAAKNAADGKFSFVVAEGKFNLDTAAETLDAAIAAANDGDNFKLFCDMTTAKTFEIKKSITLDGNGKTLAYTGTDRAIDVPNNANADVDVTIKNLNVVATTANRGLNYNENGKFNVEGVTVTIGENVDGYAINFPGMADGAEVTIKDSKLTSRNPLNIWGENMVINVYDSEIISVDNNSTYDYAAIQLNADNYGNVANGTVVNVSGGTITALNDEGELSNVVANASETGVVNISDETVVTGKVLNYVANIGGVYYGSLQAAVNKATDGQTITLMRNITAADIITINKPVTIDGKGKTLTSTAGRAINVETEGKVVIKNLTINASGERAINVIQKPANVTIDNVTATAKNYTVNVATSAGAAKVAINNSTLNGLCTVNVSAAGANVKVDNSTVNCNDNNTTAGEAYAALCLNKDAVGGSIVATNSTINVTDGSDSMKGRNGAENGTVTINGSTDGVAVMVAIIEYAGSDYYHAFATIDAAIDFAKDGETIGLLRNVDLSEILVINKAITLDGKGKTLTSTAGRAINVDCAGNVGIKNLTINAKGERAINIINKPANVTVDNVTATAKNYAVMMATSAAGANLTVNNSDFTGLAVVNVASEGSNVEINNTNITNVDANEGENYGAISIFKTATNATVVVNGGKVVVAGDSKAASIGAAGATVTFYGTVGNTVVQTVVAYIGDAGYTSIEDAIKFAKAGDVVTIMPGEYNKALNVNKAGITVQGEVDAKGKNLVKFNGKLNITANGAAVKNIDVKNSGTAAYISAADVLVENCNLEGSHGLYQSYTKGTVTFKNSVITGATYGVHFDGSTGGNIVIEGCTITGWTSFAKTIKKVTITGTEFAEGNYNFVRLYQEDITIEGCTFNEKMMVDLAVDGATATVDNCTVEGGRTAESLFSGADIVNSDITVDDELLVRVAKIGDVYYETLAEAVEAAVTGNVVTIVDDVKTSAADYATVGEEGYAVIVAVKEKDITLNLNGKSITVNPTAEELANAQGKMLMSVFGMDTNGKLTLTGNGSVKVNAKANRANVYSLVAAYGAGSAVVIENGSYEADSVNANGSLIYSHEMITVMGGTFNLGNLASGANGSPWIFNTIGQNYTGVKVVGGTYPTDINHQFWANEVLVPEAYALKDNGDGTWTVVDAVAYTVEKATSTRASWRHVGYASLEDAIAATGKYNCQDNVVTLIKDFAMEPITVANGVEVAIDLNGKTISGTDNGTANFGLINNMGDLTINGTGAIQLTATQDRGWNAYSSVISNQPGGKLTVNGGTIEHLGGTSMAYAIDNLTNGKGTYAETEINGGVVKSAYIAIRQFLNGVEAQNILNVYEGTLEGKYSIFFQDPSKSANTGSLYVHADAVLNASVYLGVTAGSTEWPVEVEVAVAALKGESTVVANNVPVNYHVTEYPTAWIVECSKLAELTIDEADYAKTGYINLVEKNVETLTYVREFTGAWETIYLPFNVKASDLAEAGLKAAYIYNASNKNNDIVIDYVEIEDEDFELMANYPYLICAAEAGVKEIVVETATLKKTTEQETIDCSTVFEKFTFIGNYAANFAPEASVYKKYYVMEGGEWTSLEVLNPFRFYFQMEKRNGGAFSEAQSIRMRSVNANGEETTGINGVDAEQAGDFIFDLHGRRVLETEKGGIYIKGGKKFIAQ